MLVHPGDTDIEREQVLDDLLRGKIELHPPAVDRTAGVIGDLGGEEVRRLAERPLAQGRRVRVRGAGSDQRRAPTSAAPDKPNS